MKLYYSPTSPYVRKVTALAMETGLDAKIERVPVTTTPVEQSPDLANANPLVKVPALVTDEGLHLFDSRVICEYLDGLHQGPKFFPTGAARWIALREQALGDGLLDAALLVRYEGFLRPEDKRWTAWSDGQMKKLRGALAEIEKLAPSFGNRVDIGTVTIACALGYLDFRYAHLDWRKDYPQAAAWAATFFERPSLKATVPAG
ncbi:glutathione S-transferase [uncultured Ferrovibrio sp.]|jgi:glutathione S-transferase|uniref:glutathione S-transferase n=1 Tax=uncultured Ferrovibrio sp. TaxID=1576913 RepID=UPI002631529B|nr:glutathione S-transferase [uncultured Ferrovibrio sp.]